MSDSLQFDPKWQALKARFVNGLTDRVAAMRRAWQVIESSEGADEAARNALFHQVHSLAGSGATFGYDELTVAARALEPALDPLRQPPHPLDAPGRAEVRGLLEAVVEEVRRVNPAA